MEKEVDKTGYKSALSKILSGRGTKTVEKPPVNPKGDPKNEGNQYGGIDKKNYPAGKRLPASERSLAMTHGPVTKEKKGICWDFSAHCGCKRGAGCAFAHTPFQPSGLHWAVECEMVRRGGHRKGEKFPPEVVDAKVQSIRSANARTPGEQGANSKVNDGVGNSLEFSGFGQQEERLELEQTDEADQKDEGESMMRCGEK